MTAAVDPDSWEDNGGTTGSLRLLGGIVVITQTPENLAACRRVLINLHVAQRGVVSPATTRSSMAH
jgi:hypothetical protein